MLLDSVAMFLVLMMLLMVLGGLFFARMKHKTGGRKLEMKTDLQKFLIEGSRHARFLRKYVEYI